jgi:flagellar motor switch protein FliN
MNENNLSNMPQMIELSELQRQTPTGPAILGGNMGLLQGVKVRLSVVVGEIHTTLGELMDVKELSVLTLDRQVDYPVDIMLDGNVVAKGQLVAVGDHFGVRVTEIAAINQS